MNSGLVQERDLHPLKVLHHKHEDWYRLWDISLRDKLLLGNSMYFSFDIVDLISSIVSRHHGFHIHKVFRRLCECFFHIRILLSYTTEYLSYFLSS